MKILKLIYVCLLLLCCHACRNRPYPYTLQAADTLVYDHPDSACTLLDRMKDSILTEPQSTQMYYQLLCIKARDKAYVTHTSDSALLQVLHYYEDRNDKKHLPEAYYYAGRVYSDLKDAPQALNYYQKATELLEGGSDYRLMKVIYSQMGELFFYQDVYEEAMKAFKKAYLYNELLEDDRGMVINLCYIGNTFTALNNADSTLFYYQKAYELASEINNRAMMDRAQISLTSLYIQLKEYSSAKASLQMLDTSQLRNQISTCAVAAHLYFKIEEMDSAAYYYKELLKFNNIYAQQTAHRGLAEIAEKKSDSSSALEHLHLYNSWTDSIKKITNGENIRKLQSLYNYQLRERENAQLKADKEDLKQWMAYGGIILILLTFSSITYWMYAQSKRKQLKIQLEKLKQVKKEQYEKSNNFIEQNKRKINELENELLLSKQKNDAIYKLLLTQKEQLLRINSKVEIDQKEQALLEVAFRQSDIYNKFKSAVTSKEIVIESKDWEMLRVQIDHCYKDFTSRLYSIYPVSDIEMKICLLLKIKINVTGISMLTERSKSTIVSARKKLYEKTHGKPGKPEEWDFFIYAL